MRQMLFLAMSLCYSSALAQGAGDAPRGSTPPGLSQDGARPAEGAIQGGSLAPGESGGMPRKDPGRSAGSGGTARPAQRCYDLQGTLRKQCLADEAVKKGTEAPRAPTSGAPAAPRE